MRIRTIKPSFFQNDDIAELHPLTRILFIGLWCAADVDGRLADKPKRLKVSILPYDEWDVDRALDDLQNGGFICRYQVDGVKCIQVCGFSDHQRITGKEAQTHSKYPAPPDSGGCPKPTDDEPRIADSTDWQDEQDAPEAEGNNRESNGKHGGSNGEATGKHPGSQEGKGREGKGERDARARQPLVFAAECVLGKAAESAGRRFCPSSLSVREQHEARMVEMFGSEADVREFCRWLADQRLLDLCEDREREFRYSALGGIKPLIQRVEALTGKFNADQKRIATQRPRPNQAALGGRSTADIAAIVAGMEGGAE